SRSVWWPSGCGTTPRSAASRRCPIWPSPWYSAASGRSSICCASSDGPNRWSHQRPGWWRAQASSELIRATRKERTMDSVESFARYALAFEQAFVRDDWSPVAEHFTEDAVYETFGTGFLAGCATGRSEVIARLRRNVDNLDRRFDERVPEILEGPSER